MVTSLEQIKTILETSLGSTRLNQMVKFGSVFRTGLGY